MSKLILFGGKGGVGKTTTSAAVAIWSASQGFNTLVVSSDPAHSTSDCFGQAIGDSPTAIDGVDNLWAVEINPGKVMSDLAPLLTESLIDPLKSLGITESLEVTGDDMLFPGLDEALAFDLLLKFVEAHEYDLVIFDTAPTGHTLRFLSLPDLMNNWITKMVNLHSQLMKVKLFFSRKKNIDISELELLQRRIEHIRRFLSNDKLTSFYIVLIPELLAVEESRRTKKILASYAIPVKGVVVNNIYPDNADCKLCSSRYRIQSRHLKAIAKEFKGLELAKVPLFAEEIQGLVALKLISDEIMGKNQLDIQGKKSITKEFDEEQGIFRVKLYYPGARKSDLRLKGAGDVLTINLNGIITEIEAPFKVDTSRVKARFDDDYLDITVVKGI